MIKHTRSAGSAWTPNEMIQQKLYYRCCCVYHTCSISMNEGMRRAISAKPAAIGEPRGAWVGVVTPAECDAFCSLWCTIDRSLIGRSVRCSNAREDDGDYRHHQLHGVILMKKSVWEAGRYPGISLPLGDIGTRGQRSTTDCGMYACMYARSQLFCIRYLDYSLLSQ